MSAITHENPQGFFSKILELVIDRILAFTDYFLVERRVTLSETTLFLFAVSWTVWFIFKNVAGLDAVLGKALLVSALGFMSTAHFFSFFFKDLLGRAIVACGYAFLYSFLMFVGIHAGDGAPSTPTLFVFMTLSVFIAVRLFRERQEETTGE